MLEHQSQDGARIETGLMRIHFRRSRMPPILIWCSLRNPLRDLKIAKTTIENSASQLQAKLSATFPFELEQTFESA